MSILRTLLIVLLLANLLFLVVGRSLFGGSSGREPGRLAMQIDPQKIRVVQGAAEASPAPPGEPAAKPDAAAPSAATTAPDAPAPDKNAAEKLAIENKNADGAAARNKPEPPPQPERCIAVSGLTGEQVAALKARLGGEDGLRLRDRAAEGSSWWVNLPPLPDRESAVRRAEEVRNQGVAGAFIIREESEHRNAVSLGLFKSEAAAQDFLRQLQKKGVTGARITARAVPGSRHTLDLRGPADRVGEVAELALAANSAARRGQCARW